MGSQEGGSLSLTGEPVGENPKQGKPAFLTQRSKTTVSCVMAPVALKKKREERLLLLLLLSRQKRKARKMLQNRSKRWLVKPVCETCGILLPVGTGLLITFSMCSVF